MKAADGGCHEAVNQKGDEMKRRAAAAANEMGRYGGDFLAPPGIRDAHWSPSGKPSKTRDGPVELDRILFIY